jgi:hypothetical protein
MLTWILQRLEELHQWLVMLERPFAFMLALPFIITVAALVAEFVRQRRARLPRAHIRDNSNAK